MLTITNLHVAYGAIQALRGIDLQVDEGELVTLIGSNGAGKTTTLLAISGVQRAQQGRIYFGGAEISRVAPYELVRRGIAHCPEGRLIFGRLSVHENLRMGAYQRQDGAGIRHDLEHIYALFPPLLERRTQQAGTLSGGEQQMLALGRALMSRPRLLLLDEPSLGLAPLYVQRIFAVISDLHRQGVTILLVEQNAYQALQVANRAYVLESGRIRLAGLARHMVNNEEVRRVYLGG
jgi:branched-chain amino acid transport system ATP-binding protein